MIALPNIFFWLAIPVVGISWAVYRWFFPEILESPFLWIFEAYIFILFVVILYKILDWYCDVWIITERGIIDVRWSLFTKDTTFTEFHDISGIQAQQHSVFDKLWSIGDITLFKMGDEMHVSRMFQPERIVETIQSHLHEHTHHEEKKPTQDMHIYLDGFRQHVTAHPYKQGFRYAPVEDKGFVDSIRKKPGTIDLSGAEIVEEEDL